MRRHSQGLDSQLSRRVDRIGAVWRVPPLVEFRTLGALAVPIIISQLAQMGMGVADAIMAGRVSATDLAGITLGGNLYWPLMLLLSGIVMAVTPSVSQLHGAGQVRSAGAIVRQALWIAICGGVVLAILLRNVEPAYRFVGVDERAIPVAVEYLRAASLGLPRCSPTCRCAASAKACPGRGRRCSSGSACWPSGAAQLAVHLRRAPARHPRDGRRRVRLGDCDRDGVLACRDGGGRVAV